MGTCTACCCLRCIEPRQCFQHSARMVVAAKVAEPGFEIIKTPAKVIEKIDLGRESPLLLAAPVTSVQSFLAASQHGRARWCTLL